MNPPNKSDQENKSQLTDIIFRVLKQQDSKVVNPVFMALIVVGLFIKISLGSLVSSQDGSVGPASAVLWGYFIVVFSLIGIIFLNIDSGSHEWRAIMKLPIPLVLSVILLLWIISLNMKYFTEINELAVPDTYFTWSNYSTILFCLMIGISVFQYILKSSGDAEAGKYSTQLAIYSYLFVFFGFVSVVIQQVILDCFTVDG
jgi:hypothetical protein